jgi:hypothetical protein
VTTHAQKPDFLFRRNGRVHLNRRGWPQFSRLMAAEVCASAVVIVVMLDTPCYEVVRRVLATHSIRSLPFTSPPCVTVRRHISTEVYCRACPFTALFCKPINRQDNLLHVTHHEIKILNLYCYRWKTTSYVTIQGVPGGMCQTSGGCSLC